MWDTKKKTAAPSTTNKLPEHKKLPARPVLDGALMDALNPKKVDRDQQIRKFIAARLVKMPPKDILAINQFIEREHADPKIIYRCSQCGAAHGSQLDANNCQGFDTVGNATVDALVNGVVEDGRQCGCFGGGGSPSFGDTVRAMVAMTGRR